MPTNTARALNTLTGQFAELGAAVPFVVSHRLTRLALASPLPSADDQAEFTAMSAEKLSACQESWQAMAQTSVESAQALGGFLTNWGLTPWSAAPLLQTWALMARTPLEVLGAGLHPVSQRAGDNARRLGQAQRSSNQSASTSSVCCPSVGGALR